MRRLPPLVTVVVAVIAGVDHAPALADERRSEAPVVNESLQAGVYRLEAGFAVGADVHVVWQVLTDFEGMSRFVPSIRRSVPLAFSDGGLAVAQEFERRAFVFTRTVNVRLLVQEQPERQIVFRDVALQDFDTYEGSWQIEPSGRGSKVTYRLTAKPRGPVPAFVGRGAFKDAATEMLVELGNEMARRSKRPAQSTPPEGGTQ